jgi:hypothetical protein
MGKPMFYRKLGILFISLPLFGGLSGCDNRPNVVMPKSQVIPAPKPRIARGGQVAAQPAPDASRPEKLGYPNVEPADATHPRE